MTGSTGTTDPLTSLHVTSPVSGARTLNGRTRPHKGVDLRARTPTPVYAARDGTVLYAGPLPCYGNVVIINHNP